MDGKAPGKQVPSPTGGQMSRASKEGNDNIYQNDDCTFPLPAELQVQVYNPCRREMG